MKHKQLSFALIVGLLQVFWGQAQLSKDYNEFEHLGGLIHDYMYKHDTATDDRKSEFIMLYLLVDSAGNVVSLNMMNDKSNEGPTYKALKNITPDALKEWKSKLYKGKLIVMPVMSDGSMKSGYLDYLQGAPVYTHQQCNIKGNFKFVIAPQIYYLWPSNRMAPPNKTVLMGNGKSIN